MADDFDLYHLPNNGLSAEETAGYQSQLVDLLAIWSDILRPPELRTIREPSTDDAEDNSAQLGRKPVSARQRRDPGQSYIWRTRQKLGFGVTETQVLE